MIERKPYKRGKGGLQGPGEHMYGGLCYGHLDN